MDGLSTRSFALSLPPVILFANPHSRLCGCSKVQVVRQKSERICSPIISFNFYWHCFSFVLCISDASTQYLSAEKNRSRSVFVRMWKVYLKNQDIIFSWRNYKYISSRCPLIRVWVYLTSENEDIENHKMTSSMNFRMIRTLITISIQETRTAKLKSQTALRYTYTSY